MVAVSTGYLLIYTGLPLLMLRFELRRLQPFSAFLSARIAIFSGTITGRDALLQVCLIPFMLMLATGGICAVLALLKELDESGLELVKRDIDRKLQNKK